MDSIIAPQRVLVPHTIAAQMMEEARRTAPRECCGVLLGCRQRDLVTVSEAWPMHNTATERSSFAIDGLALLEMADLAAQRQLSLLGPYHSHPLGPARPSKRDQQSAEHWPETLWLILDGRVTAGTSWSAWWSQSGVLAPLNAEEAVLSSAVP